MGKLILIVGGARSGKSDFGQRLGESLPGPRCFIATCPHLDSEMEFRIKRHQQDREGKGWQTVEEEADPAGLIKRRTDIRLYLLDCVTLWVNNLMYQAQQRNLNFDEDEMASEARRLIAAIAEGDADVICVSNEVGMGIVPDNPAARKYRDLVGRCNRLLAKGAEQVYLVSCGIDMRLKG